MYDSLAVNNMLCNDFAATIELIVHQYDGTDCQLYVYGPGIQ